nr:uncharacterized protein LOC111856686 [Paramormyrops kingsleyae]
MSLPICPLTIKPPDYPSVWLALLLPCLPTYPNVTAGPSSHKPQHNYSQRNPATLTSIPAFRPTYIQQTRSSVFPRSRDLQGRQSCRTCRSHPACQLKTSSRSWTTTWSGGKIPPCKVSKTRALFMRARKALGGQTPGTDPQEAEKVWHCMGEMQQLIKHEGPQVQTHTHTIHLTTCLWTGEKLEYLKETHATWRELTQSTKTWDGFKPTMK